MSGLWELTRMLGVGVVAVGVAFLLAGVGRARKGVRGGKAEFESHGRE